MTTFDTLRLDALVTSPTNPRKNFHAGRLQELADSIAASGVHQPILVRPLPASRLAGGLSEAMNKFFNDGKDEAWIPIRGTPDIKKALEIKVVDDRFVTGTGSAEAKAQVAAHNGTFTATGEL